MTSASDSDLLLEGPYGPGDVVDARYQLVRALGQGGMGTVWVAQDQVLEVHVALKLMTLRQRGSRQHALAARLLQEARAAARLGHPAICRVLNYGTTQFGDPYIASELLDGESLADRMEVVQRMSAVEAIRTMLPIMDALASAHARGIVHRDVKPDNVFMATGDHGRTQPKLLDFGIARVVDSGSKITLEGSLLGTPDYMSPEQARGKTDADGRTDVWSTCVVLYELMTGSVPFTGENYNGVLWSVMNEDPVPTTEEGAGDVELWTILRRGLDKDPDARWQSMRDLGTELAKWLYERGVLEDVAGGSLRTTWIEASFSGDRPSLVGSVPPELRGPPTLPGESEPPYSRRTGSFPGSSGRPPVGEMPTIRPGTDSRISLSARPRAPSFLGLPASRGQVMAAAVAALLLGIGGTVWLMSTRGDRGAANAATADQVTTDLALAVDEPSAAPAEPSAPPVQSVAPQASAPEAEAPEPQARPVAETPGRVVVPAPAPPRTPAPAAQPGPKPQPTPRPELKKPDDYTLGF